MRSLLNARDEGMWEQIMTTLRERCGVGAGRQATPSAGVIDSQSVRTTDRGGPRGYDGGKKLSGRKRHVLVDTTGLLLGVVVHQANIQDREGVQLLLEPLKGTFPRMEKVWVDQAYTGKGRTWIKEQMGWEMEIARHGWSGLRGIWARHPMRSSIGTRSCHRAFTSFPADGLLSERLSGWGAIDG